MGRDDSGSGFAWFLAGLGVGAIIGVLYAPKSGSETRQQILDGAEQARDYVSKNARQTREQASQWVDRGREVFNQQRDNISSAVQAGKQAYREATTEPQSGTGTTRS